MVDLVVPEILVDLEVLEVLVDLEVPEISVDLEVPEVLVVLVVPVILGDPVAWFPDNLWVLNRLERQHLLQLERLAPQ